MNLDKFRTQSKVRRQRERQGKKKLVYKAKLTTLRVHHTFLYISLSTLHDYDVKMPNLTFYGGRVLRNSTPGGFAYI